MKEHREDFLLIALVISLAVHVGLMFYVKPRVMAHVVPSSVRAIHRGPMQVSRSPTHEAEPVHIDVIKDLEATKEEPKVEEEGGAINLPVSSEFHSEPLASQVKDVGTGVPEPLSAPDIPMEFEPVQVKRGAEVLSAAIPVVEVGIPKVIASMSAPQVGGPGDKPGVLPSFKVPEIAAPTIVDMSPKIEAEAKIEKTRLAMPDFKPAEEVYEKVDEKIVEKEKEAVRDLLLDDNAAELKKFVDAQVVAVNAEGWTYFKVMVSPRHDLSVVSKDVVVLIDASGSIGKDRIGSIRGAAKQILRSCTNTGDRFNLVAFRDRYTYAFRNWQPCDQKSFDQADKWLNNVAAHGRTDVFASIRSVLTLPRDPTRPLIALVVTDGDANSGVHETSEILSRFTALNDGLISVYMYGVKSSANRELIDVLTRGNRGESFIYNGWRWGAGSGIEGLSERFRDPVLSDIRVIFTSGSKAESYPRRLRNLYRGGVLEIFGRVPAGTKDVSFSVRGLNGKEPYEGFFKFALADVPRDNTVLPAWKDEKQIDTKLGSK